MFMASVQKLLSESESSEFQSIEIPDEQGIDTSETETISSEGADNTAEEPVGSKWRLPSFLKGISIFGLLSSVSYLVISIIAFIVFRTQEYAIDITQSVRPVFLLFLGCSLAPMGIIVSPLGIAANFIAKRFKTKLVTVLNAFIFAFALLLLTCIVML